MCACGLPLGGARLVRLLRQKRRSERAGILLSDLERTDQGYELTLKRTKGAQTESVLVPLPYGRTALCPVRALARWLEGHPLRDVL